MDSAELAPQVDAHIERAIRLAELILARSRQAGLDADGRLPTERQLAQELGVSRSTVRRAFAIMTAQGRITREVGRGTFLRGHDQATPLSVPAQAHLGDDVAASEAIGGAFAPADVMTTRRLLEPPAMSLAVAWATAADIDEMNRCLAIGDRATSYEEFEQGDLGLHRAIMEATHSPLLVALYGVVETARHGHMWGDLKRRSASAERRREYQADHHQLVAAVRSRDAAKAVEAMRRHLARVSEHLNATDPAGGV